VAAPDAGADVSDRHLRRAPSQDPRCRPLDGQEQGRLHRPGRQPEGEREVLGLWIADNEGAKFWPAMMNELRNRGAQDILIAVVDGLKGFPAASTAAFPETMVQTRIVHLIRHSMTLCSWKDRKAVAADLRPIYEAPTAEEAARQLDAFEEK